MVIVITFPILKSLTALEEMLIHYFMPVLAVRGQYSGVSSPNQVFMDRQKENQVAGWQTRT
jgi:hypothetical protein